jgi:hypothetical protein
MKFLYLFRQIGTDDYKIGISKHPEKRILELNTGNPQKMELIYKLETKVPYKLESSLHKFFISKRYEKSEWFLFNNEDLDVFKKQTILLSQILNNLKENNTFCYNFK